MLAGRVIARRVVLVAGLVVMVIGTFLPWLRSGRVDRNSYAAGDALRRLEKLPAAVGYLLDAWPFLALLCALAAAAAVLNRMPIAAVAGVVAAAVAGSVSGYVIARASGSLVRPVFFGPITTLTGSCVVLVTVLTLFLGTRSDARKLPT
jgi:hypothetical protein